MSKTMRELCDHKPSKAVRAMIEGLRELPEKNYFKVDMSTFGDSYQGVCYGCAATCALIELACKLDDPVALQKQISSLVATDMGRHGEALGAGLGLNNGDVACFERAIDDLRSGSPSELLSYFNLGPGASSCYRGQLSPLNTQSYLEYLPEYEAFAEYLEENGL